MTVVSTADARRRIADILGQCVYLALGLQEALEAEHAALQQQDTDGLHEALVDKSRCLERLQSLDQQRNAECVELGFEAGPEQMQDLCRWCDENSLLDNLWQHLIAIAADCNAQNLTNGAIIRARQQHVETNLAVLRGGPQQSDTYEHPGSDATATHHRSLARA